MRTREPLHPTTNESLDAIADIERGAARDVLVTMGVLLVMVLAFGLLVAECGNTAEASEPDDALVLAQSCAGETAMTALDECTAIAEVYAYRSRTGTATASIARAYSAALKDTSGRPWITELNEAGERPPSFPSHLDWRNVWRPRWLALLDHSRAIVAGDVEPVCASTPHHFGGRNLRVDRERAERGGWQIVDCGRTRNDFRRAW